MPEITRREHAFVSLALAVREITLNYGQADVCIPSAMHQQGLISVLEHVLGAIFDLTVEDPQLLAILKEKMIPICPDVDDHSQPSSSSEP